MKQKILPEIISSLLVLLFVYAACSKLFDYQSFTVQLHNSPLLKTTGPFIAWVLPSLELLTAILLTVRATRLLGLLASFTLLFAFSLYITFMLVSGVHLPCSCGGVLKQLTWRQHLWFNLLFMTLAAAGIVLHVKVNYSEVPGDRLRY